MQKPDSFQRHLSTQWSQFLPEFRS